MTNGGVRPHWNYSIDTCRNPTALAVLALVCKNGSAAPEVMQLLEDWGRAARSKTPPGEEPPWSARNFIPYWSQLLSKEAQRGAAIEILNRVDGEAADREAARLRSAGS